MSETPIFPVFYLPPVNYMRILLTSGRYFLFEQFEHFPKQTFRNRATIMSPNGLLDLIVPVIKGSKLNGGQPGQHTVIKDVKISYDTDWQRLHWKSLETCYRSSAYFEYYEDELRKFYSKKPVFLLDLNLELFSWLLSKMKVKLDIEMTTKYEQVSSVDDFRDSFSKHTQQEDIAKPYYQVFSDKLGFKSGLSTADLLFNQGPQASKYL